MHLQETSESERKLKRMIHKEKNRKKNQLIEIARDIRSVCNVSTRMIGDWRDVGREREE